MAGLMELSKPLILSELEINFYILAHIPEIDFTSIMFSHRQSHI